MLSFLTEDTTEEVTTETKTVPMSSSSYGNLPDVGGIDANVNPFDDFSPPGQDTDVPGGLKVGLEVSAKRKRTVVSRRSRCSSSSTGLTLINSVGGTLPIAPSMNPGGGALTIRNPSPLVGLGGSTMLSPASLMNLGGSTMPNPIPLMNPGGSTMPILNPAPVSCFPSDTLNRDRVSPSMRDSRYADLLVSNQDLTARVDKLQGERRANRIQINELRGMVLTRDENVSMYEVEVEDLSEEITRLRSRIVKLEAELARFYRGGC